GNIVVTNSYGVNSTSPNFTFSNRPIINSFSPTAGPVGTLVTISGGNFNATAANNFVYFGTARATVMSATNFSIVVGVPAGATFAPITITNNNLTSSTATPFTVTFPGGGAAFNSNS